MKEQRMKERKKERTKERKKAKDAIIQRIMITVSRTDGSLYIRLLNMKEKN